MQLNPKSIQSHTEAAKRWRNVCCRWLEQHQPFDAAHDFAHLQRVVVTASRLAVEEEAHPIITEVAAWLHDCVLVSKSSPLRPKASRMAAEQARTVLENAQFPQQWLEGVVHAIEAHSFSAGLEVKSTEAAVLRDADRLDALGAIGIYRALVSGASMDRPLYQEDDPFCNARAADDSAAIIDHFYTKLLHLRNNMLTESGRREAVKRTEFMQNYLDQLRWEINI